MVKTNDDEDARVLYKKSYTSYSKTCSKTCSTVSNQTRSIPPRKCTPKGFYNNGGKMKRDLSIETDVCKARRRCKHLLKLSNVDAKSLLTSRSPKSAKSRYSNFTEIEPIEEFNKNLAGSGDNIQLPNPFMLNKEELMYNNLNGLVKSWIQMILNDGDLKNMIQQIFESAIKESESKKAQLSTSCMTYVLEKNNYMNKSSTSSDQCCSYINATNLTDQHSSYVLPSYNTMPIIYKTVRLISTLSIPRNFHKKDKRRKKKRSKKFRIKKGNHKKMLVTLIQPNKYLIDYSNTNIDLFKISTKSWLKGCINVDETQIKKELGKDQRHGSRLSSTKENPLIIKNRYAGRNTGASEELKAMPSAADSFDEVHVGLEQDDKNHTYDILDNPTSNEVSIEECHGEQYSFCETTIKTSTVINNNDIIDPLVTLDFVTESQEHAERQNKPLFKHCKIPNENNNKQDTTSKSSKTDKSPKYLVKKSVNPISKLAEIRHREFVYSHNQLDRPLNRGNDLLKHLKEVFEYFDKYEKDKDIRLEIQVNVFPAYEDSTSCCSSVCQQEFNQNPTFVYNMAPGRIRPKKSPDEKENAPNIIPILDGAVSQAKYLLSVQTSPIHLPNESQCVKMDQASMTNNLGIKEELHEIKTALKHVSILVHQFFLPQNVTDLKMFGRTNTIAKTTKSAPERPQCQSNKILKLSPSVENADSLLCPYCRYQASKLLGKCPSTGIPSPEIVFQRPSKNKPGSFESIYCKGASPNISPKSSAVEGPKKAQKRKTYRKGKDVKKQKEANKNEEKEKRDQEKVTSQCPDYGGAVLKHLCSHCRDLVLKCSFADYKEIISKHLCRGCTKTISSCPFNALAKKIRCQTCDGTSETILSYAKYLCHDCKNSLSRCLPQTLTVPLIPTPTPESPPKEFLKAVSKYLCPDCKETLSNHFSPKKVIKMPQPMKDCAEQHSQPFKVTISKQTSPHAKPDLCSKCQGSMNRLVQRDATCETSTTKDETYTCYKDASTERVSTAILQDAILDSPSFQSPLHNYSVCCCPSVEYKNEKCDTSDECKKSLARISSPDIKQAKKLKQRPSPGFQISNRMKILSCSGFKFSKAGRGPSKKISGFSSTIHCPMATSYRVIASESLIQVTEMASTDKPIHTNETGTTNIALTCSLPITKSLYEVSREKAYKVSLHAHDRNHEAHATKEAGDGGHHKRPKNSIINAVVQQAIGPNTLLGNMESRRETKSSVTTHSVNVDVESGSKEPNQSGHRRRLRPLTRTYYVVWFIVLVMLVAYVIYEAFRAGYFKTTLSQKKEKLKPKFNSAVYEMQLSELGF